MPFLSSNPSPFAVTKDGGMTEGTYRQQQMLSERPDPAVHEEEFMAIGPDKDGKIGGMQAKEFMFKSKLNNATLHKIWSLSDVDRDGKLTLYEFALCKHFVAMKLENLELPSITPEIFMTPPPPAGG